MSSTEIVHDHRRTIRILVADADDETRSLYGESLRLAGCDVIDAADGRDAMVKALSHRPTLIITETRLPFFDGCALCEVLRRDSTTRSVPILIVTAENRPTELDRARGAGADVVLIKPVPPDILLKEVQRLLGDPANSQDVPATGPAASTPRIERRKSAKAYPRQRTRRLRRAN